MADVGTACRRRGERRGSGGSCAPSRTGRGHAANTGASEGSVFFAGLIFFWLGGYDCAHEDHWIDVVPCRRLQFCSLGSLYKCCDMARLVVWGRMCLLLTVHSACWMRW